ncbi:MAG: PatB family C-S lyase [Proteobacteria bacterium]|nr:PatB family C-S lyase [Pseudomonadota bacterium]
MSFDFETVVRREGTASVKWDGRKGYFNSEDLLPMWVADMDFAVPEAVSRAVKKRAGHPVFGYTLATDSVYESLISWMRKRHGYEVQRDWVILSPGVVPSLHAAAIAFARPGEGVIVQPPVYFPFFSAVTETDRRLILNPLRLEDGRYRIDFDHLEGCAGQGARLLILCTPHNPVGRVWSEDELRQVLDIARRHDLVILSDEIHHDLIFPGSSHIPLHLLAGEEANIVTAVAPSKTFNIPGLGLSALIVPNPRHRVALRKAFELLHLGASNPFSLVAFEAAYREGEEWLEALLIYLTETRDFVSQYLAEHIPKIKVIQPEGTYLLWLDCRELGMNDSELKQFFIHKAKVGMNPGTVFGEGGSGFMRMNIGTSKLIVAEALERIRVAVDFGA